MPKQKVRKDKKKSHRDCLKLMCFCCLQKKNEVRPMKESEIAFICAGPNSEFRTNSDFLPSSLCATCRQKMQKFMSDESNQQTEFSSSASVAKYDSIVNE